MSNDSISKNSVSYLSTDSSHEIDINNNQQQRSDMFSKKNSTNSGYLTRSKKSVSYILSFPNNVLYYKYINRVWYFLSVVLKIIYAKVDMHHVLIHKHLFI
jgi:hypothetical protein